jgi:hypothetical protein
LSFKKIRYWKNSLYFTTLVKYLPRDKVVIFALCEYRLGGPNNNG